MCLRYIRSGYTCVDPLRENFQGIRSYYESRDDGDKNCEVQALLTQSTRESILEDPRDDGRVVPRSKASIADSLTIEGNLFSFRALHAG